MHRNSLTFFARAAAAALAIVAITACAATGGPDWTYAPLGPTPSGGVASPTPAATAAGDVIEVSTPADNQLAFVPSTLDAPANTDVTVRYTNDSGQPHNINVLDGPDASAASLGKTAVETGPAAIEDLTFTTPGPGDYYFFCDVHGAAMSGMLHVQ